VFTFICSFCNAPSLQLKSKTGVNFGWGDMFTTHAIDIDAAGTARMIVFVKTMKKYDGVLFYVISVSQKTHPLRPHRFGEDDSPDYNEGSYVMHPIPLTEAILHHAYNNEESSAIRARIMDLEQKLRSLAERRKAVESFEEQLAIEEASRELRERFDEEKAHWKKLSWAMEVGNCLIVFVLFCFVLFSFCAVPST